MHRVNAANLGVATGRWRLRTLLTLLAVSNGTLVGYAGQGQPSFVAWVWQQLQGYLGRSLLALPQEAKGSFTGPDDSAQLGAWLQEAHLLCMSQVRGHASQSARCPAIL